MVAGTTAYDVTAGAACGTISGTDRVHFAASEQRMVLVFCGSQSVEFWQVKTDITAPFATAVGRGYQRGCIARDTVAFAYNSLLWEGDDLVVCRVGSAPMRGSSFSIQEKIHQCGETDGRGS